MQELLMFMYHLTPEQAAGSCPAVPVLADRFWSGSADLAGQ